MKFKFKLFNAYLGGWTVVYKIQLVKREKENLIGII